PGPRPPSASSPDGNARNVRRACLANSVPFRVAFANCRRRGRPSDPTGGTTMRKTVLVVLASALVGSALAAPAFGRSRSPVVIRARGTSAPAFVRRIQDAAPSGPAGPAARAYLRANRARYHVDARSLRLLAIDRFAGITTAR